MLENYKHTTVLLDEAVNGLNIRSNGIYIDGTFGRGGHSRLILSQLGPEGRLLAIDRDPQAIAAAKSMKSWFTIVHGPFSDLSHYVRERELVGQIDGVLLDLAFLRRSWMTQNAVSPSCVTAHWICAWTHQAASQPLNGC